MGAGLSKDTFDSELARAKAGQIHTSYDVTLGRDFTDPTEQARDPKCVWARKDGAPVARIRLGRAVIIHDLITLYDAQGGETNHEVTQDDKTDRLEMEPTTLKALPTNTEHPSFAGVKIFFGARKWRLVPISAERRDGFVRDGVFVVQDGFSKNVDPKDIVGFIRVQDFIVTEFVLSRAFDNILVASVLYVLTRVCNGVLKLPNEKGFTPRRVK